MMDQYSQHKLKKAATEPEHIMRKAEFDQAVESLDERIVSIEQTFDVRPGLSAGVMKGHIGAESFSIADESNAPATPPLLLESTQVVDNLQLIRTFPEIGMGIEEITNLTDIAGSAFPSCVSESTALADDSILMTTTPDRASSCADLPVLADAVHIMNDKMMNGEQLKLQGEIEVLVEDRDGNVTQRQIVTNTISEAYERYMFYDMMTTGNLSNLLRSNTRSGFNFLTRTIPASFGLYAMDCDIALQKNTFLPPYVGDNLTSLSPSVSFYNVGGTSTESTQEMLPVDLRCFYDKSKKEYVFEYTKNTGVGTVKSVCVGRSHTVKADKFSVALAENATPSTWQTGTINYFLEHTTTGSCIWKGNTNTVWRNDLVTRSVLETISGTVCAGNLANASLVGGLVAGNVLYKAAKQSAADDTHVVRLSFINRFRTSSTIGTKDITFTCRAGMSVNTTVTPVMVMRPDRNKLEIFVTLSIGDHDGTVGCNLQKAVISNLDDPVNLTIEIEDLGILPYAVSNWTATTVGHYLTGFHHDGKYYLPVYGVTNDDGNLITTADAAFQTGLVVPENFSTVLNNVSFRTSTANEFNAFVLTDDGVVQCRANAPTIPYVHMSQILSGTNLPTAVTKSVDDVLRIIYRYRIL